MRATTAVPTRNPSPQRPACRLTVPVAGLFDHLRIDLSTLPTRFPYLLITPQYEVERVLEERAVAAGVRIVRDANVTALRQDAGGVDLTVGDSTEDHRLRNDLRLYEVLRDGKFVLLAPDPAGDALPSAVQRVVLAPPADAATPWTLVRPDAHIAWRGHPGDLRAALITAGLRGSAARLDIEP